MADKPTYLSFIGKDEVTGVARQVDKSVKDLGVSAGATGKAMTGIFGVGQMAGALALGASITAVTGFLAESTKAAIDEEQGIARLGASLKANIPAWDGNTAAIEALLKQREALAFSDDDLRNSLSILVGSTHDVNKALELQTTAMDLARFKGIDLQTASEALIKVEGGHYRALQELGIQLKAGASQTEALAAVQKVAGGQAQAFGNTTAGAMQAASIAVHDLQEEVGAKLAPVIKQLADFVRTQLIPAVENGAKAIGDFTDKVNKQIRPVEDAIDVLANLKQKYDDLTGGVDRNQLSLQMEAAQAMLVARNAATLRGEMVALATQTAASRLENEAFTAAAYGAGQGLDAEEVAATRAETASRLAGNAAALAAQKFSLLNLEARTAVQLNTTLKGTSDAMAQFAGNNGGDTAALQEHAQVWQNIQNQIKAADAAQKKFSSGGGAAVSKLSSTLQSELVSGLNAAKTAAERYYSKMHDDALRAIDDALKLAEKQHSQAIQLINDNLRAAQAANAAPVTAAEQALQATETAQQLRDLQEAVATAQQGGNALQIRNATEALQNFQAQQAIDQLKQQQATADTLAQQQADQDTKKADAALTAAQQQATQDKKAADDKYAAQKLALDAEYKLLVDHHAKVLKEHGEIAAAIEKLYRDLKIPGKDDSTTTSASETGQTDIKAGTPIPSHAQGLSFVPRDNYLARLHQGEMVVPAQQAAGLRAGGGGSINVSVSVQGAALFDPFGVAAQQIGALILPGLNRAVKQNGGAGLL